MTEKNCLVTGATSGHGEAVALYLAENGANVILHGRNPEKLARVQKIIEEKCGYKPDLVVANFSSMESVKTAAKEFVSRNIKLDLLVNNAGMVNEKLRLSKDGYEEVFAVNYLAMYAFTLSILPALKKDSKSRIVIVASDAHYLGKLDLANPDQKDKFSVLGAYYHSKLAVVLFTLELAEKLKDTNITVNAVDPGPIASGIAKKNGILAKIADFIIQVTFPNPLKAAKSCLYLCMSPEVKNKTGGYFRFMKFKEPKKLDDPDAGKKLWAKTVEMTGVDI